MFLLWLARIHTKICNSPILWTKKRQLGDFQWNLAIFDQKAPIWRIFSAKNRQFDTFLKTRNPTRVPGFFEKKTRNPPFQNPTSFVYSLMIVLNSNDEHNWACKNKIQNTSLIVAHMIGQNLGMCIFCMSLVHITATLVAP